MGCMMAKPRPKRVVVLGLDGAGKTTILYKLMGGEEEPFATVPTVGFNVEECHYQGVNMIVWDIGGQAKIRALWSHYLKDIDRLIYVIDASDKGRIREAKKELVKVARHSDMHDCKKVLVMANKQDMPNRLTPDEIRQQLGLPDDDDEGHHVGFDKAIIAGAMETGKGVSDLPADASIEKGERDEREVEKMGDESSVSSKDGERADRRRRRSDHRRQDAEHKHRRPTSFKRNKDHKDKNKEKHQERAWPPAHMSFHVQGCCALTGEGLAEGLRWLWSASSPSASSTATSATASTTASASTSTAIPITTTSSAHVTSDITKTKGGGGGGGGDGHVVREDDGVGNMPPEEGVP